MTKKILLAGGCSYTDKNFISNLGDAPEKYKKPMKMWPEHVSERLDLQYMNVGRSGFDNQSIYNELLQAILTYNERIDTVMVLWTSWDRFLFMHEFPICFHHIINEMIYNKEKARLDEFSLISGLHETMIKIIQDNSRFVPSRNVTKQIRNSLFLMYSLAKICESKNIKYVFGQGVTPPLNREWYVLLKELEHGLSLDELSNDAIYRFSIEKSLLKTPVFPHLEKRKKHIIGWPFIKDFGGYTIDEDRRRFGNHFKQGLRDNNRYHVSKSDRHPNEEGQEIISRYFIEKHRELYH